MDDSQATTHRILNDSAKKIETAQTWPEPKPVEYSCVSLDLLISNPILQYDCRSTHLNAQHGSPMLWYVCTQPELAEMTFIIMTT